MGVRSSLAAACAGLALAALTPVALAAAEPKPAPRLVVVIAVDQFGSNLFNQYRPQFTGGLKTLASEGLVYANGFQAHANSETCPGHSTILTGKHPNKTGIPTNDWLDRDSRQLVYCFRNTANTLADGGPGDNGPVGPEQMRATTLGDWLKAAGGPTRVYGVSGKDRGAIALTGQKGDGVFWYLKNFGFTTWVEPGQNAEARLAPVAALNARIKARFAAEAPGWTYRHDACRKLEGEYQIGGQTWKSTLPPQRFAVENSPLLDELTLEAAQTLLTEQKLGQGSGVDVLGVSLSGTDRIGHGTGTQGPEMCEQLLRLDEALGVFLTGLKSVPGGVIVVLTADHGGSDFPERSAARGFPQAGRSDLTLLSRLNANLRTQFKLDYDPVVFDGNGLYVFGDKGEILPEKRRRQIAAAAVTLLRKEPTVAAVHTLEDLTGPDARQSAFPAWSNPEELTLAQRMTLSAVPGRSADIQIALNPGITLGPGRVGGTLSSHGSVWDYDRKVPIIFWWPGVTPQERFYPISTIDIAPTLANILGVWPPEDIDGRCMDLSDFGTPCPRKIVTP
jgi:predicted AlkP superfamily pyrophosphatase or phosphodiesterase